MQRLRAVLIVTIKISQFSSLSTITWTVVVLSNIYKASNERLEN